MSANSIKFTVVGALALAGSALASVEAQAIPVQYLNPVASTAAPSVENVWWRGGYGWRRGGYYGYGWRRPFYGYGWGWRRPFYGYGWGARRAYGWRRW